ALEGMHAVGGVQRLGGAIRRRGEPRSGPQTPPAERSATGGEKQGHDRAELGGRGLPGRRRPAPRAGQRFGQPPSAFERRGSKRGTAGQEVQGGAPPPTVQAPAPLQRQPLVWQLTGETE